MSWEVSDRYGSKKPLDEQATEVMKKMEKLDKIYIVQLDDKQLAFYSAKNILVNKGVLNLLNAKDKPKIKRLIIDSLAHGWVY